jgi:superfamily I DNA and/or RNA helicase
VTPPGASAAARPLAGQRRRPLVCLTLSRAELDQHVDTLFVDEAGQVALADAVAVGTAAQSIVFLGDPNQLPQVSQGTRPPAQTHPSSRTS